MADTAGMAIATHIFTVQLGAYEVETVQEVSGLSFELDAIDHFEVTRSGQLVVRKLAGARKGGEVTISRGLGASGEFTKWLEESFIKGNVKGARQSLSIIVKDTENNPVRTINLKNAWVKKWEGPNLKAGESQAALEKVTVVFEDVELK
ncbi:phage tail protein [Kitasatospora herbaricolor]|uniref:phage tail protein n=1 Tax=Kitasatospora herbaricolor TaxID=68217 RepID=UPI00174E7A9F|nr:phage tail protein [Kitasatospora herbaricolor]MDQ0307710.1 phage tail-like protein [Kitasatospora herbaricolor]GGV15727.1 phage tail protein [Kitasatospora herbaricolor]